MQFKDPCQLALETDAKLMQLLDVKPYKIVRLDDEGEWQVIRSFYTYHQADMLLDKYCDKYPNTMVDILYREN